MSYLAVLVALLSPVASRSADICESRDSIHQRARYCHQNWAFVEPAHACVQKYADLVSAEQARLNKMLAGNVKAAKGTAQNLDFSTHDTVLKTSLDEVGYLIDYGKQVHTELEDYAYSLTLPIYDRAGAAKDPSDPDTKAQFSQSECYGDPVRKLESMELQMRPWISQLEKTKTQLTAMAAVTVNRDDHLGALSPALQAPRAASPGTPAPRPVPAASSHSSGSTITGKIHEDPIPLLNR